MTGYPMPGPYQPEPAPTGRAPSGAGPRENGATELGHPAVDAVVRAMANAADLPLTDQIAQYEAAHRTLQETLATIDHA